MTNKKTGRKVQAKKVTGTKKQSTKKQTTKKGMENLWKKTGIGLLVTAVLYIAASFYFSSHFFPRTVINGYECQFKTVEQVKEIIKEGCKEYELILKEREEREETITALQLGLQFVDDDKLDKILEEQKSFTWIQSLFKKPVYENAVTMIYDEGAFMKVVDALACLKPENMRKPEAAYPSYVEANGQFEIIKEDLGTTIEKDVLIEQIQSAILSDREELDLDNAGCYVKPAFYSSDTAVVEAQTLMNQYISTQITYDMGYTGVKVEKAEMAKWLKVDEQSQVIIDQDKIEDFVEWLGNNYNTCGIPRKFKTPENTTVTVSGGTYGWRIHFSKEVEQLEKDMIAGGKIEREPIYRQTAYERDTSGNDLHDTYIAISIKSQTMWYYKDGKCLLTTPVVTGNTSKKMGTPTGVYAIAFKQRNHILRGEDYESSVDYWLPFYEYRGIGIHDASWREADAFGKEIYKTNGSHGCVNTPYKAVKSLYEMVAPGTPVVVY